MTLPKIEMKFPKLDPLPIEADPRKENLFPTWKCFCCHDTGLVVSHLVKRVIEGYDSHTHKPVICSNCDASEKFESVLEDYPDTFDLRFNAEVCNRLSCVERTNWLRTVEDWVAKRNKGGNPIKENRKKLEKLTSQINFGKLTRENHKPEFTEEDLIERKRIDALLYPNRVKSKTEEIENYEDEAENYEENLISEC